ncbi:MAG: tetratricopeptide repeat protein [bacterium]
MKPNVIDVSETTFEAEVVTRSFQVPVLVDFWAPWCGPCRALTPTLEDLAEKGAGAWVLAKVNSDENPGLAERFGVRGIPNVKAFRDGVLVDEFTGALPRAAVERFLEQLLPSELDGRVTEAVAALERGELAAARTSLESVLATRPDHDGAVLALAKLELDEGHPQRTLELVKRLPDSGPAGAAVRLLRAQARFATAPSDESIDSLAARVAADPKDLDARFALAEVAARDGDLDRAAEELLGILARKRDYRSGEGRLAFLDVLELMGAHEPRTERYRSRLSMILFS